MLFIDLFSVFITAMINAGLTPPKQIINDGQIHRFSSNGKPDDKAGYYALFSHPSGFTTGFFGCWRSSLYCTWSSKQESVLSDAEKALVQKCKLFAQTKRQNVHTDRASYASELWGKATPPDAHPYIQQKQLTQLGDIGYIKSLPCRDFFMDESRTTVLQNVMLIPIYDANDKIQSLQAINASGKKFFMKGGKIAEGRFTFHGDNETIYLCEGYATGSSIHQITNATVICTFSASNLEKVTPTIQEAHPDSKIIIAADNDHIKEAEGKGNKGLETAKKLAEKYCLSYTAPSFSNTDTGTDWNDYAKNNSAEITKQALLDNVIVFEPEPTFDDFNAALNALREDKDDCKAFTAAIEFLAEAGTLPASRMRKQLSETAEIGIGDIRKAVKQYNDDTAPPVLTHHQIAEEYCKKFGLSHPIGEYGSLWFYNPVLTIWEAKGLNSVGVDLAIKFENEDRCQREQDYKAISSHTYNFLEKKGFFANAPQGLLTPSYFYCVTDKKLVAMLPSHEHRARFRVEVEAAENGSTPTLLLQVLHDAFAGNHADEQIRQLRMFLGMALFGLQNKEQRAVLLYGAAGSGKSLFLKIIESLVPREYITNVSPVEMGNDYKVATLAGKLLNLVPEIDKTTVVPSDKFKSIVGGDTMQAREPYGKAFSFTPSAANWFNGNFFLTTRDHSEGFWRRWVIVHFMNTKPAALRDPDLLNRIIARELSAILRWAMDGVNDYLENGLYLSPAHHACLSKWKNNGNSVASWLQDSEDNDIGYRAEVAGQPPLKVTHGYTIYKDWCQHNNRKPFNKQEFKEQMALLGSVCSLYQGYSCYTDLYDARVGSKFLAMVR
ncbi:phage/plasmid primase, P4 family [Photobacterium carnosum]|uniref:phage/plasmid primase, P4 family n=1 Tax=Photobacterium carnosum TaxID=2023717 RepID=UPI001E3EDA2E|nr:phage/plasmid primase, P4 family [Photobacterium carnosum]MCD9494565.1 hypothetical protein [Photobacterium carnosum]